MGEMKGLEKRWGGGMGLTEDQEVLREEDEEDRQEEEEEQEERNGRRNTC